MVPALVCLAGAFSFFESGRSGLGAACAVGFLALIMGAGLAAQKLSRHIEVTDAAIREERGGKLIEIRWDEPHDLVSETRVAKRAGVAMVGNTRLSVRAPD